MIELTYERASVLLTLAEQAPAYRNGRDWAIHAVAGLRARIDDELLEQLAPSTRVPGTVYDPDCEEEETK